MHRTMALVSGPLHQRETRLMSYIPGVATAEVPRKRKRNLRGVRSNGNGVLPRHAPPNLAPNDQPSVGLALTVSNLLSRHGAIQEQFFDQFSLCSTCNRIVCIELSRLGRHTCVIEVED